MTTTASLSVKKPYKFKKPPLASESQTMPTSTTTLDFGSLMSLPISNEENQKLEEQVNEQKFKLEKCQREISGLDQSIQTMWQHLQNIRSDVDQNQSLLRAKDSALETERKVVHLTKLEVSKLQSDVKSKENTFKDLSDKQARNHRMLDVKKKELEKIILDSGQSKEDFESELAKVLDADGTNVTIQKDMIIEEHITIEMSAKLERLNEQCAKKRKEFDTLQTELKAIQLNLDKANSDMQKEQYERLRLIQQCESAMGIWTKKESNFEALQDQLTEYRSEGEVWQKNLKEKTDEVKSQHTTNKELLRKITQTNEQLSKLKTELNRIETSKQQLQDEILGEKAILANAKSQQKSTNVQMDQLRTDIVKKENIIQQLAQNKENHRKNIDESKTRHETNEEKIKRLNLELNSARSKKIIFEKNKNSLIDFITKKKDQIANGKVEVKKITKEIDSVQIANRNLNSKLKQLEREGNKYQENIESKENDIKRLEREMELISGSEIKTIDISTSTSTVALKKKLDRIKLISAEKDAALQTWESTFKRTEGDLDKVRKDLTKVEQLKKIKDNILNVLQAETDKQEKASKKLIEQKQDLLVQSNLLKVAINRLEDTFNEKNSEVLTVGQEKENLSLALKTHQQEIRAKKDAMQIEYCQLEEERKKMSIQFKELLNKIEQLKNRYDIYVISLRPPDNGTHDVEKYFVTKYEKEKEELTNLSEELNLKIRKTEREVLALENTLKLVTGRNHSFRQGIIQADRNCPEYQEKLDLEAQYRALGEKYSETMKELKLEKAKLEEMEVDFNQITKQQSFVTSQIHLEHMAVEKLKQETAEQEQKLERWDKQTTKTTEEFRKTRSAGKNRNVVHLIETDIDLQQQKMLTTSACKIIALLSHRNPETADLIVEEFRQYDLPLDFSMDSSTTATKRSDTDSAISSQRSIPSASTILVLRKVSLDADSLPRIEQKSAGVQKKVSKRSSQSLPRVARK